MSRSIRNATRPATVVLRGSMILTAIKSSCGSPWGSSPWRRKFMPSFARLILPPPRLSELLFGRPHLIESVGFPHVSAFHDQADGIRVADVFQGIFIQHQQVRELAGLDRTKVLI